MNRRWSLVPSALLSPALLLTLAACQAPASANPPVLDRTFPTLRDAQPLGGVSLHRAPDHASVPDLGGGVLMVESGDFAFTGATAHGEATLDDAVLFDATAETLPTGAGTGGYALEIEGTRYESSVLSTVAAVLPDAGPSGETYLVLGGYRLDTDAASREVVSVLWAMVPLADVAAGATVALDGERTLAYFATGPTDAESPEVVAITASGTLTFGDDVPATFDVGASLSASLEGEFGRVEVTADPDPGSGVGPSGLAAGDYTLSFPGGPSDVFCDGALAGHEADFAGLGPEAVGLEGGAVTATSADVRSITLSGPAIEASFATPALATSWQDDAFFYLGFAEGGGVSLGEGTRVGTFAYLAPEDDGASRPMFVGAVFAADPTAPDAGQCQVGWEARLSR